MTLMGARAVRERGKILILHSLVGPDSSEDEKDVLSQAEFVAGLLEEMGFDVSTAPFLPDLDRLRQEMARHRPRLVFNLVESVEGRGRLIHLAPAFLEHLGMPHTGSSADAIYTTSNKLIAKRLLHGEGLPTPWWLALDGRRLPSTHWGHPWILKSVWEHASIGLNDSSVVCPNHEAHLLEMILDRAISSCDEMFAEAYIDGREFNVSLLARGREVEVLPPAEMIFDGYPSDKWKIVDYRAKWDSHSYEALHTRRSFHFSAEETPLLEGLKQLALHCWRLFSLNGYARIDFRVDETGKPWILEVNTNPCLSPDAGFSAAAERAGLDPPAVMNRILGDPHIPGGFSDGPA